jgi:hypothetical protein
MQEEVFNMPWCPKCRLEYQEGFEKCNDCDSELVEELEAEEKPVDIEDVEAYLKTTGNSFEAEIIESKLNAYGIPVMRKYKEAGGYLNIYMGATPFGIDLYVPSKLLEKAQDIISLEQGLSDESEPEISMPLVEDELSKSKEEAYNKKRRAGTWIILLFITPAFLYMVYLILRSLVNLLK